jgi:hypothetical protein
MTEHRFLTGASVHEPKGVEVATAGQVYVADGAGSGAWSNRLTGIYNLNSYGLAGTIANIAASPSSTFVVVPTKSSLVKVYAVLSGALSANVTLTIYKNGISQTPTITVTSTGSGAGVASTTAITPNISANEGDVFEVRATGGSGTAAVLGVSLRMVATA